MDKAFNSTSKVQKPQSPKQDDFISSPKKAPKSTSTVNPEVLMKKKWGDKVDIEKYIKVEEGEIDSNINGQDIVISTQPTTLAMINDDIDLSIE